jgi:hypothetical protein
MNIELTNEGYYLATGEGELRLIVAEGGTEGEARANFYQAACDQYAECQRLGYLSDVWMNGGGR